MVPHIIRNQLSLAQVRHLIGTGCDVNAYDMSGWTPLLRAAYHGRVEVARELIRANADVHLKIKEARSDRTVLHVAACYIYKVWLTYISILMKFILGTNTEVDEQVAGKIAEADMYLKVRESGRTVLHVAACYGHQALVKLFLRTSIGINEQDDEGRTALMLAVQRGHSGVVAELVKAGADVSLKDNKGMTAVLLAKSYDTVRQLIVTKCRLPVKGGSPGCYLSRADRSRILWHACDVGNLSMVRSVIEAGCDVDHIHKGQTPVMMATLRGHDSIVKELILANCDVNFRSGVIIRNIANTVHLAKLFQAGHHWTEALVCSLLPWMQFQIDVEAALWTDPVWSSLVLLAMSVLAILGVWLMPGSRTVILLGTGMVAIAMIIAMKVAMVAGPVAWTTSLMAIVATPLVVQVGESTMAEVTKEVAGTVVLATFHMCVALAILFVVPVILVWSPRDITGTEVVAGALIMVVVVSLGKMLLERLVLVQWNLVVALLERVIRNAELFVIASSCMMIARKTFVLHESQAARGIVELLAAVVFFIWFLLMVLRAQATEMVLYRGAAGIVVFEGIKLLKMENALVSPDNPHLVLVLVVLLLAGVLINLINHVAKAENLLKALVVFLHLVVGVVEAYLALVISKPEGAELGIGTVNLGEFVNITVVLAMVFSIKIRNYAALHYAAFYNHIKSGVLLVEAGAEFARNIHHSNLFEISSKSFVDGVNKVLTLTTKRVIAVIGNSECGKSTLVAALECTSNILWKKAINRFRKVHDIRQRTAGIEAVPLSSQKYGEALFYDFAGQSQYHGPHQSFLEAMLIKPEDSVTLLLLVKATEEEEIITQQLHRWLQPLAQRPTPFTPQVIVVGSFLDQAKSEKEACEKLLCCTQSVQSELCFNIQGPCLLDCRHPESRGINQICSFLQEALPINTNTLSYNLHWVLVQVRKAFSTPALRLHEFQTWLQDAAVNLPRNLPSPEKVCQDLSAAGHTLLLPNKQDPSQSWLVLDLPTLLHDVYGTLFSGSHGKVNKFGLLHCSQLAKLFPNLGQTLIQEVLISLEFCIEVDPLLLKEELLQLTIDNEGEGWLYFPALVSAQPCKVFPEDPGPEQFQWMCWQLRTAEKHFISAHLLQTIILRLAANHVFTHMLAPNVRKHCCRVWVNGLSWRSTKGVDVAVQINDSSVVQIIGRSQAGTERLQQYVSTVVRNIIATAVQLSPQLKATSYIVHPYTPTLWANPQAPQPDSLYPVSSITRCISDGDDHVLSLLKEDGDHPQQMSLPTLFGSSPSLSAVQDMDFNKASSSASSSEAPLSPLLSTPTLNELNQLVVWRIAARWYEVGLFLEVGAAVLDTIRADNPYSVMQACRAMFHEWLSQGPGTGEQPREWQSVLGAVKETLGEKVAEEVERVFLLDSSPL